MSPFKVVTGYKPKASVDIIPMSATHRPLEFAFAFTHHIYLLHGEVRRRITLSNEKYKWSADYH